MDFTRSSSSGLWNSRQMMKEAMRRILPLEWVLIQGMLSCGARGPCHVSSSRSMAQPTLKPCRTVDIKMTRAISDQSCSSLVNSIWLPA